MITVIAKDCNMKQTVDTYETIEAAAKDIQESIFELGCCFIEPQITDGEGKRYTFNLSIINEVA